MGSITNMFFDWYLNAGVLEFDIKNKSVMLFDYGLIWRKLRMSTLEAFSSVRKMP